MDCASKYVREGHPSVEELAEEQGVTGRVTLEDFPRDLWPEDDIEEFLSALRQWRGSRKSEPAA